MHHPEGGEAIMTRQFRPRWPCRWCSNLANASENNTVLSRFQPSVPVESC